MSDYIIYFYLHLYIFYLRVLLSLGRVIVRSIYRATRLELRPMYSATIKGGFLEYILGFELSTAILSIYLLRQWSK